MGPAPSLATYQQAAQSVYEPQKQAEATAIQSADQTTKNSLEAEKGQVGTDYQSAVDKLTQNVQDQSAQIAQTYNQRLSGMFSGLQGNDMGQLFARTNEAQSIIEQTRANKLAQITAGETNADIKMNADLAALAPKYQGLEADYAQKGYNSAVSAYDSAQYRNAQLQLSEQRLADSEAKGAQTTQDTYLKGFTAKPAKDGGYDYFGPNGEAISLGQWAMTLGQGNTDQAMNLIINQLQGSHNPYDKQLLGEIKNGAAAGFTSAQTLGLLQKNFGMALGGVQY